jgi:ATP-binding cassette, subfamily B, bacterial PglK
LRAFLLVRDLMTSEDRWRLLGLLPAMLLASLFDLAIVASAATFFMLLTSTRPLHEDGWLGALFGASGLQEESQFLVWFGVAVFGVVVGGDLFSAWTLRRVFAFSWSQITTIGERTFASYLNRPYEFFLVHGTPDLSHRLLVEVQAVVDRVIVQGAQITARMFGVALLVGWLAWRDPLLSVLLMVALGGAYVAIFVGLRRSMIRQGTVRSTANKLRHRLVSESLVGIKEIKLHGLAGDAVARFHEPSVVFARAMMMNSSLATLPRYALESIAVGGIVLIVVYMLAMGRPIEGTLGVVATYGLAAFRLLPALQQTFATASQIQFELQALGRIHTDVMTAPRLVQPVPAHVEFRQVVELRSVGYTYPTGVRPVVSALDLSFAKGTWTALVGATGSGKTTIADLLMGLLSPQSGELCVDGRPLSTPEEIAGWQSRLGYVPQSIFISDATIAANIAFGTRAPDQERIVRAARAVALADFIEAELPQRYDTPVGERGIRLSGGQRQRLGLARGLYKAPDLLVLDEATSALDNETEARVMENLRSEARDTTVVMIAHRLSTTRYCDEILLLDQGRIVDRGDFDHLAAHSERFRALLRAADSSQGDAEPT